MAPQRSAARTGRALLATLALLAAATALAVAGAGGAHAHTGLVSSTPSANAVLETAPVTVTLEFAAPVAADDESVEVTGPDRAATAVDVLVSHEGRTVTLLLPPGDAAGRWTVGYRVRGSDGHVVSGVLHYAVRSAAPSGAGIAPVRGSTALLLVGGTATAAYLVLWTWTRRVSGSTP
jgi:hypothetical protein